MHHQVLALGLRLPMTKFIRNVLIFYKVVPSQLSTGSLEHGTRIRDSL